MTRAAAIVVASLALLGCARSQAPTSSQPSVRFLEAGGMAWMNERANATGVRLDLEGPGDVVLYRTDNSGRAWTKVADIPRSTWSYPVSMTFSDASNGEIGMDHVDVGDPEQPAGIEFLATRDGGRTWQPARRTPADGTAAEKPPRLFNSSGHDGSSWELDLGAIANPRIVIRRRAPRENDWLLASTLPTRVSYADGHTFAARGDDGASPPATQ